jgi:hypothetical protein
MKMMHINGNLKLVILKHHKMGCNVKEEGEKTNCNLIVLKMQVAYSNYKFYCEFWN